jgi:phosphatidate cytidylyltransferase
MKRVATAVVLIPLVLLLVLRAPVPLVAGVTAIVALLASREFLQLTEHYGVQPFRIATYIYVTLPFVLLALTFGVATPLLTSAIFVYSTAFAAVLSPFIFLVLGMRKSDMAQAYPAAAASVLAFTYTALPLACLVQLRQQWAGAFLIVYLLVLVWVGDTSAYYVGKNFGRHLMSPRVSPKKTWEGAAASLIGSMVVGYLFFTYAQQISGALLQWHLIERRDGYFALQKPALAPILLLSVILNVAAQLGDLVESLIKRGAGIKDSGALLPGHGGILDRIDALLFAAPVLWYYAVLRVMQ